MGEGSFVFSSYIVSNATIQKMIITKHYEIMKYDSNAYSIKSLEAAFCPACKVLMSGYDTRRRHCIERDGTYRWYLLRRLRCPECKRIHLEMPDFMEPKKHYNAQLIRDTVSGIEVSCPAEDSTIRRWKNNPPGLPRK